MDIDDKILTNYLQGFESTFSKFSDPIISQNSKENYSYFESFLSKNIKLKDAAKNFTK